jgi:hypothetical protein
MATHPRAALAATLPGSNPAFSDGPEALLAGIGAPFRAGPVAVAAPCALLLL